MPGPADETAAISTVYRPPSPLDLRLTLAPLARGRGDPTTVFDGRSVWRTAATPDGPGLLRLTPTGDGAVRATAWGAGAAWLVAGVPDLLGARDDPSGFVPVHPVLADAHRRHRGLRIGRCGLVFEMLAVAVLEQKVTGRESRRSWRALVTRFGATPPGPAPAAMKVAPTAEQWRRIPSWEWHRAGVDDRRARTVLAAAAVAPHLERTLLLDDPAGVAAVLQSVPGVGPWTAAEVAQRAHGDADAVSVGDYHLPTLVGMALTGAPVDDAGMLALLECYAGHRHRAVRLVEVSGVRRPRFGPRMAVRDYRGM